MKLISNGAGTYLTSDAIADAVVRLGVVLSNAESTDVVELPFRASDGGAESVNFMLGLHTTVNAATSSVRAEEVVDASALNTILGRLDRAEQHGDTPMAAHELVTLSELDS